jgi:TFIIF-interacting CTD phosphatase-like protein
MIIYRGHQFEGYNKPRNSWLRGKKMVVLAKVGSKIKLIHFGDSTMQDFRQHQNEERRKNYLRRSAGIRDKQGRLTKDNKLSANYWSRRILW